MKAKDPWKYVEPKDLTQLVTIDDKKWYFCTKCKCRATGKVGFYQLSHTDATHDPNWAPEGNVSPITDSDPTPLPPRPPIAHSPDDDDLVFTGIHLSPVYRIPRMSDEREMALIDELADGSKQVGIMSPKEGRIHTVDVTHKTVNPAAQ